MLLAIDFFQVSIVSLSVIIGVVSLLMLLLVLMQRPKSEGLGAAFGGGMTDNLFGAQTTNVLQKATRVLGGTFFAVALIISILYSRQARGSTHSAIQQQLASAPAPKETGTSAGPATSQDALQKLIEQKVKEAQAAAAANSGSASPAASPTTLDLGSPAKLQLQSGTGATGTGDDLQAPPLQLQTGTAAKKDGGL